MALARPRDRRPQTGSFVILLVTRVLAFAILVMSLDILLGYTGLASLGQAAYLGVGAYLTAILATKYQFGLGWDFWLVIVFGIVARRGDSRPSSACSRSAPAASTS